MTKTKNPQIRCDVCGRKLSQYHLNRHRGTIDCVRLHYQRAEIAKHAVPPGYVAVQWHAEKFLWWAFGQAGFDAIDSPLAMKTFWRTADSGEPAFGTIAPKWAAQAALSIYDTRDANAMDVVVLARHLHANDNQESIDQRLALSAEIELTCVEVDDRDGYTYRQVNHEKVQRVMRRWASAAMGGIFPDS